MLAKFYSIAANTFLETIRQPVYAAVLLITILMMIDNVGLAAFTLEDDDKLLRDLGLNTLLLSGLFLAAFSATSVLTREIENKTVMTVLSKPVGRIVFILGKYAGLIAALLLAFYISLLAFAMSLRHAVLQTSADPWDMPIIVFGFGGAIGSVLLAAVLNYVNNNGFMGTMLAIATPVLTVGLILAAFFDPHWNVQPFAKGFISPQILLAALLVLMEVMILAAVALAASTRMRQIPTLLTCLAVLAVGLISDHALQPQAESSTIIAALYRALPNLDIFWVIDGLNAGIPIPWSYVGQVGLYAAFEVVAILMLGVALFQTREVG